MNIGEEKAFLYGMMQDITLERRRLTEMYHELKERLNNLNRLEEKGIGELSTKGFFDMFNDRETHIKITNVQREAQAKQVEPQLPKVEQQLPKPRFDKMAALREEGEAERAARMREAELEAERDAEREARRSAAAERVNEAIRQMQEENEAKQSATVTDKKPKIPLAEIERAKEQDRKVSGLKHTGQVDLAAMERLIIEILKEHGRPIKAIQIFEELNKRLAKPVTMKNFSGNIMYRAKNNNPKIDNVTRGYYQYKG